MSNPIDNIFAIKDKYNVFINDKSTATTDIIPAATDPVEIIPAATDPVETIPEYERNQTSKYAPNYVESERAKVAEHNKALEADRQQGIVNIMAEKKKELDEKTERLKTERDNESNAGMHDTGIILLTEKIAAHDKELSENKSVLTQITDNLAEKKGTLKRLEDKKAEYISVKQDFHLFRLIETAKEAAVLEAAATAVADAAIAASIVANAEQEAIAEDIAIADV
jgi:hypothetical protein